MGARQHGGVRRGGGEHARLDVIEAVLGLLGGLDRGEHRASQLGQLTTEREHLDRVIGRDGGELEVHDLEAHRPGKVRHHAIHLAGQGHGVGPGKSERADRPLVLVLLLLGPLGPMGVDGLAGGIAEVPRDPVEALGSRSGDPPHDVSGSVADRQHDARFVFTLLGAQLAEARIGDGCAGLLGLRLGLDAPLAAGGEAVAE